MKENRKVQAKKFKEKLKKVTNTGGNREAQAKKLVGNIKKFGQKIFGDGSKGLIDKFARNKVNPPTTTTTSKTGLESYVKPGGKATGKMKDYKLKGDKRKAEYDARGWKYDDTIKGYNKSGNPLAPPPTTTTTGPPQRYDIRGNPLTKKGYHKK